MSNKLIGFVRKDELLDIITALWMTRVNGNTSTNDASLQGYYAALQGVAIATGLILKDEIRPIDTKPGLKRFS